MSQEESGARKTRLSPVRVVVLLVLLCFVAVSVGYLVYTQVRPGGDAASPATGAPAATKTVVVCRVVKGMIAEWAVLIEVWEFLVDQKRFSLLVRGKVREHLAKT